jgi:hypothetical protein
MLVNYVPIGIGPSGPGLKVHKHEIFVLTFFAETETLWSQGPVTREFWKSIWFAEIFDF